jgi:hypothetical protein
LPDAIALVAVESAELRFLSNATSHLNQLQSRVLYSSAHKVLNTKTTDSAIKKSRKLSAFNTSIIALISESNRELS